MPCSSTLSRCSTCTPSSGTDWPSRLSPAVSAALAGTGGVPALFLFAVDESHLFAALWLANRNALVAAVPVLFGLCAHLRWREDGWRWGLPLSLGGYVVGLLGGETALGALAYLAASRGIRRARPAGPARGGADARRPPRACLSGRVQNAGLWRFRVRVLRGPRGRAVDLSFRTAVAAAHTDRRAIGCLPGGPVHGSPRGARGRFRGGRGSNRPLRPAPERVLAGRNPLRNGACCRGWSRAPCCPCCRWRPPCRRAACCWCRRWV